MGNTKGKAADEQWPSQWRAKAVSLAEVTTDRIITEVTPLPAIVVSKRACKGLPTNDFFPPVSRRESRYEITTDYLDTFNVCYACPVRQECLQHAMDTCEDHGIWGGIPAWVRIKSRRKGMMAGDVIAEDNEWRSEHHLKEPPAPKPGQDQVALECCNCGTPFLRAASIHRRRLKTGSTTWFHDRSCKTAYLHKTGEINRWPLK